LKTECGNGPSAFGPFREIGFDPNRRTQDTWRLLSARGPGKEGFDVGQIVIEAKYELTGRFDPVLE
jgi:hypothetical protein